jgi:chloramphenicol 3-O-phosphotransferase
VVSGYVSVDLDEDPQAFSDLDLRYRIAAAAADTYAGAGFTVALQDIVLGDYLSRYVSYLRSRPLHVIVLVPRPDVVAAREAARPKTAYRPGSFTVEQLDNAIRTATPRIGLWLDTSDHTPDETVDEILARKSEALV